MTLKLLLCRADGPKTLARDFVLDSARLRYQDPIDLIRRVLSDSRGWVLICLEAEIEPPITSTISHRAEIRSMEIRAPPAGIFELPPNVQKVTRVQ
jgi:hypothetical protein